MLLEAIWHLQRGDISSGSELLHPFPFIRGIRVVQVFALKFNKNGSAYSGNQFADGSAANQPVILQGCRSLLWPDVSGLWPVLVQLPVAS